MYKVIAVGEGADDFAVGTRVFGNAMSGGLAPFAIMHAASAFKVHIHFWGWMYSETKQRLTTAIPTYHPADSRWRLHICRRGVGAELRHCIPRLFGLVM